MEFRSLEQVGKLDILQAFNLAFENYFVPLQLTTSQFEAKLKADNTNLSLSVGAFDNDVLVGFILHGTKEEAEKLAIYNGGTGVLPSYRGQGLTKQMYGYFFTALQPQRVSYLILEVISSNHAAIKSYKDVGYRIIRELNCCKGQLNEFSLDIEAEIIELEECDWPLLQSFWDVGPSWQNSIRSVNQNNSSILGAFFGDQLVGYLVYSQKSNRIQQIAVHKKFRRRGVASNLVNYVKKEYGPQLSVINIESTSLALNGFFAAIGLEMFLSQLEMKLDFG